MATLITIFNVRDPGTGQRGLGRTYSARLAVVRSLPRAPVLGVRSTAPLAKILRRSEHVHSND